MIDVLCAHWDLSHRHANYILAVSQPTGQTAIKQKINPVTDHAGDEV